MPGTIPSTNHDWRLLQTYPSHHGDGFWHWVYFVISPHQKKQSIPIVDGSTSALELPSVTFCWTKRRKFLSRSHRQPSLWGINMLKCCKSFITVHVQPKTWDVHLEFVFMPNISENNRYSELSGKKRIHKLWL